MPLIILLLAIVVILIVSLVVGVLLTQPINFRWDKEWEDK